MVDVSVQQDSVRAESLALDPVRMWLTIESKANVRRLTNTHQFWIVLVCQYHWNLGENVAADQSNMRFLLVSKVHISFVL